MPAYLMGTALVGTYGLAVLASLSLVLLASDAQKRGQVTVRKFATVGLGFVLMAALVVGFTMYAVAMRPEWWHKGEFCLVAAVAVGIVAGACALLACGIVFKDVRR